MAYEMLTLLRVFPHSRSAQPLRYTLRDLRLLLISCPTVDSSEGLHLVRSSTLEHRSFLPKTVIVLGRPLSTRSPGSVNVARS